MSECLFCFACGVSIGNEDELVILSGDWEEEIQVPCHRDCGPEDLPVEI